MGFKLFPKEIKSKEEEAEEEEGEHKNRLKSDRSFTKKASQAIRRIHRVLIVICR